MPPALGIDQRIVNGYLYLSPNVVTDPELIAERAKHFQERAGYYYEHWDELYAAWIKPPPGAEGWERLYPYYYFFSEDRRDFEEGKLWFFDQMHNPEAVYPFDTIMTESWWVALNQYTTRVWVVPPALGIDQRIVNGYLYLSPNVVTDPELIAERAKHFEERAGYYYEHWEIFYR